MLTSGQAGSRDPLLTVIRYRLTEMYRCGSSRGLWTHCAHVQSLSRVRLCDPKTAACQAPRSMGFFRQGYWSGLPFPSPEDLPNPGIELTSPALSGKFFTTEPLGKPKGSERQQQNIETRYTTYILYFVYDFFFNAVLIPF